MKFDFVIYRDKIEERQTQKFKKLEQILDRYQYLFDEQNTQEFDSKGKLCSISKTS